MGTLSRGELLDKKGRLVQSGYAFSQQKLYERAAVKASRLRIKEWDYYSVADDEFAVALTVADNSYMSLASVSVLDFKYLEYVTKSRVALLPKRLHMPSDCNRGDTVYDTKKVKIAFVISPDGSRTISAKFEGFDDKKPFECELRIAPYDGDNITVAVPFKRKKQFYYNTKINCLKVNGIVTAGDKKHEFKNAFGGLDWGRGVWPYKSDWYWSSLSTQVDGVPFGFNLGYGFGQPTDTENTLFYDGKAHKLGDVKFEIPFTQGKPDYVKPWKIADTDGRIELIFYPLIDRKDKMRALWLSTDQHQVFGKFYGRATLDDGSIVTLSDKLGFAERVKNRW